MKHLNLKWLKRLALIAALAWGQFSQSATFSENAAIYRLQYQYTLHFLKPLSPDQYFEKVIRHNSFLIGAMAYVSVAENQYATGAPLRKKRDLKVLKIEDSPSSGVDVTYEFNGEAVLDVHGLNQYFVYLPSQYEAVEKMDPSLYGPCSIYVSPSTFTRIDVFPIYWNPLASGRVRCEIEYQKVKAVLTPVVVAKTYPQYARLVNSNNEINVALFTGKIAAKYGLNPYRSNLLNDTSAVEYRAVIKRLLQLGFVREEAYPNVGNSSCYREVFSLDLNGIKIRVNTVYGDSVNQEPSMAEFNSRWLSALKESSVLIYNGHSGFWVDGEGLNFYKDMPSVVDQNQYQIMAINGCQSNYYLYPIHELKSRNLDLMVNLRPSITNAKVSEELLTSIVDWARTRNQRPYADLVDRMNAVGALLGVVEAEAL